MTLGLLEAEVAASAPDAHRKLLLCVHDLTITVPSRDGALELVSDAHLEIATGSVVGLVGETGSGKSLVARSMAGLLPRSLRVTRGSISFDGAELLGTKRGLGRQLRGPGIAYVPQNPFASLEPVTKIERQFRAAAKAHTDWTRAEVRQRALDRLHDVGIREPERVLSGYTHQLSGGMAQRVVIALSTLLHPRLVIADEPTTGLDPTVQKRVLEMLVRSCTEIGSSVLLISHDLGIVSTFADQINVMYAGRTVERGEAEALFSAPLHPYTYGLLASLPRDGSPGAVMPGTLPEPSERGEGCPFAARCGHAGEVCRTVPPLELAGGITGDGRWVACHLHRHGAAA
jgi:peptide/nickel transport system ATP-binding protein